MSLILFLVYQLLWLMKSHHKNNYFEMLMISISVVIIWVFSPWKILSLYTCGFGAFFTWFKMIRSFSKDEVLLARPFRIVKRRNIGNQIFKAKVVVTLLLAVSLIAEAISEAQIIDKWWGWLITAPLIFICGLAILTIIKEFLDNL